VLSGRTRGLVGAAELALMKPTARLVNTSRGPIVVEADLIAALRAGRIAGARIDVFDVEPPAADHPFRTMDGVTITPHLGYVTRETLTAFYTDTLEALVAFADGAPIRVANPDALAHARQRGSS
jgi:phosphoglycerate dehydrogenase-like enzyme